MAVEQGWGRRFEFVQLSSEDASTLIGERVLDIQPLTGGRRNTNYRLVRRRRPSRLCCASIRLILPVAAASSGCLTWSRTPCPCVLRVEPAADPAWSLMTFIQGERFDNALRAASSDDVERLARSAGVVLAKIHRFTIPRGGFFDDALRVTEPVGPQYGWSAMLGAFLDGGRVVARLGDGLTQRLARFVNDNAWREGQMLLGGPCLSHSDYNAMNLLVRDGHVVAVLDWEFAFAAAPLNDIGNFLRYSERQLSSYEAGFVAGYRAEGGLLPDDWKRLSRMVDLINLCDFLNRDDDPNIVNDVRSLVQATLDEYA